MNARIRSKSGVFLSAIASKPAGPVIIICHGYRSSGKNGRRAASLSKALEKAGFTVIRFDFYGHGQSGGKFEDVTVSKEVQDLQAIINYARKKFPGRKICVAGGSLGGMVSILAAAKDRRIAALVLKAPVSNFKALRDKERTPAGMRQWKRDGFTYAEHMSSGKRMKINYSFYEDGVRQDVYAAVRKIRVPVLIAHGDADESVSLGQSRHLLNALGSKTKRLQVFRSAGHLFGNPGEDEAYNAEAVRWLWETLG